MRITSRKVAAAPAAMGIALALVLPTHTAQASPQSTSTQPRVSGYVWSWSDGAGSTRRTFSQSQYGAASRLPKLVVEGNCGAGARVGDRIKLSGGIRQGATAPRTPPT
ncbi:MAG: hypothetical protein RL134_663 [Actinomycetota bacterium]